MLGILHRLYAERRRGTKFHEIEFSVDNEWLRSQTSGRELQRREGVAQLCLEKVEQALSQEKVKFALKTFFEVLAQTCSLDPG